MTQDEGQCGTPLGVYGEFTSSSGPTWQFPFPRTVMMCKVTRFPEGYTRFVLSIFKNTHVWRKCRVGRAARRAGGDKRYSF